MNHLTLKHGLKPVAGDVFTVITNVTSLETNWCPMCQWVSLRRLWGWFTTRKTRLGCRIARWHTFGK